MLNNLIYLLISIKSTIFPCAIQTVCILSLYSYLLSELSIFLHKKLENRRNFVHTCIFFYISLIAKDWITGIWQIRYSECSICGSIHWLLATTRIHEQNPQIALHPANEPNYSDYGLGVWFSAFLFSLCRVISLISNTADAKTKCFDGSNLKSKNILMNN